MSITQTNIDRKSIRKHIIEYNKKYYQATENQAINTRKPWTPEEDELVINHEMPDRILASKLHRSQKAIQVRRHKLRLFNPEIKSFMHTHKYTAKEIDQICDTRNSLKSLAQKFGISVSAAGNMRYKYRDR